MGRIKASDEPAVGVLNSTVAGRTKLLRRMYNEGQKEFAARLGISQSRLSTIEQGLVKPDLDFIVKVVTDLQIDPYWYLTGEERTEITLEDKRTTTKEIILKLKTLKDNELIFINELIKSYQKRIKLGDDKP